MQLLIHSHDVHIPAQGSQATRCGTVTDNSWRVQDVDINTFRQQVTCPKCVESLGLSDLHYTSQD